MVIADEIGYLAHARVLAGGPPIDLSTATYYYPGSSLFITPAFWLAHDPLVTYQIVLVVQALISAAVLPLLYALLHEVGVARGASLTSAAVAVTAVDSVFWSNYALAESSLAAVTVLWVWLTARLVRLGKGKGRPTAALLGLTSGLLAAVHSRGVVLVLIGVVALIACIRWIGWRNLLVWAATSTVAITSAYLLNVYTMGENYPGRSLATLIPHGASVGSFHVGLGDQITTALGQVWYAGAASAFLAVLGLLHGWYLVVRPGSLRRVPQAVAASLVTLAGAAVTLGAATVIRAAVSDPSPDYLVYGRYVSSLLPVLIAWGVVALLESATRAMWIVRGTTVAVGLALAALVRIMTATANPDLPARPFAIPGVSTVADAVAGDPYRLHELRVTAVGLALFTLCCVLSALRWRLARGLAVGLPAVAFTALAVSAASGITMHQDQTAYPDGGRAISESGLATADSVAWDESISGGGVGNVVARLKLAYFARDAKLEPFDPSAGPPPDDVELVLASREWDGSSAGLEVETDIPGTDVVIWREAG